MVVAGNEVNILKITDVESRHPMPCGGRATGKARQVLILPARPVRREKLVNVEVVIVDVVNMKGRRCGQGKQFQSDRPSSESTKVGIGPARIVVKQLVNILLFPDVVDILKRRMFTSCFTTIL